MCDLCPSDPFFITKGGGDNAHKRAGTAATLVVIDAIERRRIMFDLEQEGIGNEEVFEEVDEVGARRNSTVVLQRKRRGRYHSVLVHIID